MFVQSERFIEAHGGRRGAVSVYGQELNDTTRRLCLMNLALRGIEADVALGDTFHDDRHTDLKAHYVLANPPFNVGAQLVARRPPAETSATARPPGVSDVSDVSDVFPGETHPLSGRRGRLSRRDTPLDPRVAPKPAETAGRKPSSGGVRVAATRGWSPSRR
jgi:hypothetical protein